MSIFTTIQKEQRAYDTRREQVIKKSRDILKESKRIIFLIHESKLGEAKSRLAAVTTVASASERTYRKPIAAQTGPFALYKEGSWSAAIEEYLEAWFLYSYIHSHKIAPPRGIRPSSDVLIGALSDTTGELVRLAVIRGADKDSKTIQVYRKGINQIIAGLIPLHLSGHGRQKFDQAKRNMKRIEEILYEVKIRD